MLFDLRGRRRRAVQATYLMLAVLMGGGLVLFGIGGGVSGGLLDAFQGGGGGSSGNELIEKRIDREQQRLAANPQNEALLKALVRDNYALATSQIDSGSQTFPDDAKDELRAAAKYWQRYLETHQGKPDPSLAGVAFQIYDVNALNDAKEAQRAMGIIAEERNDSASYLQLVAYAARAGDTRTANLAAIKAVDLAPKGQKQAVKKQAEALKNPQQQQSNGG